MTELSKQSQTSQLRPVDLNYAHDIVDGDLELLQEIIDLFLFDYPLQLAALQQAVADKNALDVQAKAHRLKCSLGNIGGWQAHRLAHEIELMGQRGDLVEVDDCLRQMTAVIQSIEAYFAQLDWVEQTQVWLNCGETQ